MAKKGKTQRYYDSNPAARKAKAKYQKKYDAQPMQIKRRTELKKLNRTIGKKGDGKDVSHRKDGSVFLESPKKNRARNRGRA